MRPKVPVEVVASRCTVAAVSPARGIVASLLLILLIGACSSPTGEPDPTTTPTSTVDLPVFPQERQDLEHGGPTWAVVLAGAADAEDPAIAAAERAATEAGYTTGWTDCDEGAAEALGMPGGTITLSVYFDTEDDARAAAAAFAARDIDGVVAEVRTYCLD